MVSILEQYQIFGTSSRAIASSIEDAVTSGILQPGATLPSVRQLASELEVSPATVASAYRDLRFRGMVTGHSRSRTTVSPRPPLAGPIQVPVPEGVRDLATGNPDPQLLPDLNAVLRSGTVRRRLYREAPVVPEFAAAVPAKLKEVRLDESAFTVVGGAMDGVERVLQAHLRAGDRVAVEDPGYPGILDLLPAMGLERYPVHMDDEGIMPDTLAEALRSGVSAIVVTPRAQNPTGALITPSRADELRAMLDSAPEVLLVEDDHFGLDGGSPYNTLISQQHRWAHVRSVSKTLGPDLRVALLAADPVTVSRVEGRLALGAGWVSSMLQRLVATLWNDSESAVRTSEAASTYSTRRQALIDALQQRSIAAFGVSGLNVWIPVDRETSVVTGLLEKGWGVGAGEAYRLTAPPAVRVTSASLLPKEAEEFATDLLAVLQHPNHTRTA